MERVNNLVLDYCNSLLYGTSNRNLDKLQCIQNLLARTVVNASCTVNATEVTRFLHWLPIRHRIQFKIGLYGFNARHSLLPSYMQDILSSHHPTRQLRSSSVHQFFKPAVNSNFAALTSPFCVCPVCVELVHTQSPLR